MTATSYACRPSRASRLHGFGKYTCRTVTYWLTYYLLYCTSRTSQTPPLNAYARAVKNPRASRATTKLFSVCMCRGPRDFGKYGKYDDTTIAAIETYGEISVLPR
jgi:hypothetical protein